MSNRPRLERIRAIIQKIGSSNLRDIGYQKLRRGIEDTFWHIKGNTKLGCNGLHAIFDSTRGSNYRKIKWRYKTESEVVEDLLYELRQDDVYYDVGAGFGLHTCLPAKKLTKGRVVSIEPYPPHMEQVKKNVELNNLDNVITIELALSDSSGDVNFNEEYSALTSEKTNLKVETSRGDRLVSRTKVPSPTAIKIDVEGSEPLVIEGLKETLRREGCRLLYCEVHLPSNHRPSVEDFGMNLPTLKRRLKNFGFSITTLKRRNTEIFLKGKK